MRFASILALTLLLFQLGCQRPEANRDELSEPSAAILDKLKPFVVAGPDGLTFRADEAHPGGSVFWMPPPEALPLLKDIPNLTTLVVKLDTLEKLKHLEPCVHLRNLDVNFGIRLTGAETIEPMNENGFTAMKGLKNLETLKVRKGGFGSEEGAKTLSQLPQLQVVEFEVGMVDTLVEGLKDAPKLKRLVFRGVPSLTDRALPFFADFKALEELEINCEIDPTRRREVKDDWMASLHALPNLKTLKVRNTAGIRGSQLKPLEALKPKFQIVVQPAP